LIDEFAISTIAFSPEYQKAVEKKQIARQKALEAKYFVEQAKQEAKSIIIQAEADAETIKLIGDAVKKNPSKTLNISAIIINLWTSLDKVYLFFNFWIPHITQSNF